MLLNETLTAFLGFLNVLSLERNSENLVQVVSQSVFHEITCHSVLFVKTEREDVSKYFPASTLWHSFSKIPIYNYKNNRTWIPLSYLGNSYILVVVHLTSCKSCNEHILNDLWDMLKHWSKYYFILFIDDIVNDTFMTDLLHFCKKHKSIFTIALQGSAVTSNEYYTMEIFPKFSLERRQFDWSLSARHFYPNHKNLHGHAVRICSYNWPPYSYVYESNGKKELVGFYGSVISEFVRQLNGTLTLPYLQNPTNFTRSRLLAQLKDDGFDICAFPVINPKRYKNLVLTYSLTQTSTCFAVPYGEDLKHYKYFLIIMKKEVLFLIAVVLFVSSILLHLTDAVHERRQPYWSYILNINLIGLILGLAVYMKILIARKGVVQKIILITLTLSGTILSTSFIAFLQSFTTKNPTKPPIQTAQQLIESGLNMFMENNEYDAVKDTVPEFKYLLPYVTTFRMSSYLTLEEKLTGSAFAVGDYGWTYFNARMEIMGDRTHILTEICPLQNIARKLPVPQNSIYIKHLSRFLVYIAETGLHKKWFWDDFYRLNAIRTRTQKYYLPFEVLEVKDLRVILIILAVGLLLATCVFIAEIYWAQPRVQLKITVLFKKTTQIIYICINYLYNK